MRIYSRSDEERIRAHAQVRAWSGARLLDAVQATALEAGLRVELKRTNTLLRAGLALFTALVVIASVLLIGVVFRLRSETAFAITAGAGAVACLVAAECLVRALRLYRYGVEEALAGFSALLSGISATFASVTMFGRHGNAATIVGLAAGGAVALGVYRRFGYVYALVAAAACAAMIPFQLDVGETVHRLTAFAIIVVICAFARRRRVECGEAFPADDYATLQTASLAGAYLVLNLHVWYLLMPYAAAASAVPIFYWMTYVAIWIIPVAGFRLGIRQRDRALIDVSIVLALATIATNKLYLGWPRREWDPMVLGVLLIAVAIALRRWLARGPGGRRGAFTAAQILSGGARALSMIATASTAFHPHTASPGVAPGSDFRGGRSGGGGGGSSF
jgi:hypothetical protein